jgi:hypothetical protein
MAIIWVMVLVVYNSDAGGPYNVAISVPNKTAGSFNNAAPGAQTNYPRGWKMRHVYGLSVGTVNESHKLPIASAANALYQSGGNFSIAYIPGSVNFTVQGKIGEKRTNKL